MRFSPFATFMFCCCGLFFSSPLSAEIRGLARVIDADTLVINGHNIRLYGIDAPELSQECRKENEVWMAGQAAAQVLRMLLKSQIVLCLGNTRGIYNRLVARCQIDGVDLGSTLVRKGWAFDSPAYSKGLYADEEDAAQQQHLGIWAGSCDPPWVWRRGKPKTSEHQPE